MVKEDEWHTQRDRSWEKQFMANTMVRTPPLQPHCTPGCVPPETFLPLTLLTAIFHITHSVPAPCRKSLSGRDL